MSPTPQEPHPLSTSAPPARDGGRPVVAPAGGLTPADIQGCFSGPIAGLHLQHLLAALRADADWLVLEPLECPPERFYHAVYRPTGQPFGFRGQAGADGTWRFERAQPGSPRSVHTAAS